MMPTADQLAQAAIAPIESGMLVGLGTGRAASRGIAALALRVNTERIKVTCVATSRATEHLATQLGLRLVDPGSVSSVDYLFDGADEVDPGRRMVKGGGGAMTRERIVARMCSGRRVYMIDASKLSPRLGVRAKLPIEVLPLARQVAATKLDDLGLEGGYRVTPIAGGGGGGQEFVSDNGALVMDVMLPEHLATSAELSRLGDEIRRVPGVIDHGLFLDECDVLLIEHTGAAGVRIEQR